MAKNQHRNLTGDALHNPKGFDGASNGTKPFKDGAGALDWITETQLPKALDYVSAQSAPPTEVAGDVYLIDTTGTAYDINTIAWQSGNTIRIAFNGSPDLSAVAADDYFITSGNGNSSNDGTFIITTVNDGSDYIEITNNDRSDATDDEATDAVGTGYYTLAEWDAVSKISHVTFDGSIWSSITPSEGQSCYDVTLGAIRVFDGTDWSSSLTTGGISGSGTTNYLARWTPSGSALGNSVIQDDGTQVHVGGTPTSSTMLKVTPVDKYGIYVDSDQNTSSDISAYIADIANTGIGNIQSFYSTSAGSNDASANVSLFHSNGVTAGTQANSYGLYLTAHTAGTAKWGIYQAGANDKNYFAGAMQFDTAAAATGYVWTATDADGNGDWAVAASGGLSDVVDDITPQLGGSLDVNGQKIVSVAGGNIDIEPNGTGNVLLGNFTFDADQTVGAGQDNYVLTYDNATGLISLEAAAGGGGGLWTDDSGGKISYSASGASVNIYESSFPNTYGSAVTIERGFLMVGDTNTIGHPVTATNVRRSVVFGSANILGSEADASYNIISGSGNDILGGDFNGTIGQNNIIKGNKNFSAGVTNLIYGDNNISLGTTNTIGTTSANVSRSVAIGEDVFVKANDQIVIGFGIDTNASYSASKGIYVGIENTRPNSGWFTDPLINTTANFAIGGRDTMRTDIGVIKSGTGAGLFYLVNYNNANITEPTANAGDSVALYAKDRTGGKSGLKIKAEDGTNHFFSDFSAIGGDQTVATANKTLTIAGTGTGSGTSSLVAENSAGTVGLEVRDDLVVVMPNLPTSSAGLPTGGLWNNSGVINIV